MASESDPNNKETPSERSAESTESKATETEKSAASAESKATETEKSDSPPSSASDKLSDAAKSAGAIAGSLFTKAKGLADEAIKTAKSDETKQNLNNAAKTAGVIAGKVLAKAKDAAGDVKKELGNVNDLRKESFANTEAGTSKKDMAKGFWAKLSGKQKGILAGILAIFVYFSYSVLFSGDKQKATVLASPKSNTSGTQKLTPAEATEHFKNIGGCLAVIGWNSQNGKPLSPELRALLVKYKPFADAAYSRAEVCHDHPDLSCRQQTLSPQDNGLMDQGINTLAFLRQPQSPNTRPYYETAIVEFCTPLMFMK